MSSRWTAAGALLLLACGGGSTDAPADAAGGAPDAGTACETMEPVAAAACAPAAEPPDALDSLLAGLALDRCTLGWSESDLSLLPGDLTDNPDRLPWFDAVWRQPAGTLPFARDTAAAFDAALASDGPVSSAITAAAVRLGQPVDRCAPAASPGGVRPLADAVAALVRARGGSPDEAALAAAAAAVPADLQRAVAGVVAALAAAAEARDAAIAGVTPGLLRDTVFRGPAGLFIPPASNPPGADYLRVIRGELLDYRRLFSAAADLAAAVEAAELERFAGAGGFDFRADTPLGAIVIADAGEHRHEQTGAVALLIDTGGDDVYTAAVGATIDSEHGVSLAIDLAGADDYGYVAAPDPDDGERLPSDADGRASPSTYYGPYSLSRALRQGSGSLGIGLLIDLGGAPDRYRSLRTSQGYGSLGVGVLYDDGGDDRHAMEAIGQGSALFGIGLLLDGGGADEYRSYTMSQGFAANRAVGALVDGGDGADTYWAEPVDRMYYSPQLPDTGNTSMAQGASMGMQSSTSDLVLAGGLGLLRDGGGADAYTASVFAQGTGYLLGLGLCMDAGGDDRYDGRWYVQGASAHLAVALLQDDGGADRYDPGGAPAATSIGVGHDFSAAWHVDGGGDDDYTAPGLSLGSGNMNGIGALINDGGDDIYRGFEPTLGAANLSAEAPQGSQREARPTVGLFVDTGGTDTYDVPGSQVARGNGATWSNPTRTPPIASERSLGKDL